MNNRNLDPSEIGEYDDSYCLIYESREAGRLEPTYHQRI